MSAALLLDSSGVSRLAEQSRAAAALIVAFRDANHWPPRVPSVVLVESLHGHVGRDAPTNRFLKTCDIVEEISEGIARRAAHLQTRARCGSPVDAVVVAMAEPNGTVLTSDPRDMEALAEYAIGVSIVTA